jgi:hypothetical protein
MNQTIYHLIQSDDEAPGTAEKPTMKGYPNE